MAWLHQIHQIHRIHRIHQIPLGHPAEKRFMLLQESIKDPLLKAKFKFVEFIAEKLEIF